MWIKRSRGTPVITSGSRTGRAVSTNLKRSSKNKKSPRDFRKLVREWPVRMINEVRRIHWVRRGELFKRFLVVISFVFFFAVVFAVVNQLLMLILHQAHVL